MAQTTRGARATGIARLRPAPRREGNECAMLERNAGEWSRNLVKSEAPLIGFALFPFVMSHFLRANRLTPPIKFEGACFAGKRSQGYFGPKRQPAAFIVWSLVRTSASEGLGRPSSLGMISTLLASGSRVTTNGLNPT